MGPARGQKIRECLEAAVDEGGWSIGNGGSGRGSPDDHAWVNLIRLACGRNSSGEDSGWDLQFLALEALSLLGQSGGDGLQRFPLPSHALSSLAEQIYRRSPVDAESCDERRMHALFVCSAAVELIKDLARTQTESLVLNTQVVWGLCWLRSLPAAASQPGGSDGNLRERMCSVSASADAALSTMFWAAESGVAQEKETAGIDAKMTEGGSILAHFHTQRAWILDVSVLHIAPVERWGAGRGDKAVVVLQRDGTRRLVFDRSTDLGLHKTLEFHWRLMGS